MKKSSYIFMLLIVLLIVFGIFTHKLIFNVLAGRVSFPKDDTNQILTMEDGQKFTVLRTLHVKDTDASTDGYSVFIVRFKFKGLSFKINKRLSIIPAPFLMNLEGFVQKSWTFNNQTGEFQGIYQWKSEAFAKNYPHSFVFKLMTKRAAPGTITYEILPNTILSGYFERLMSK